MRGAVLAIIAVALSYSSAHADSLWIGIEGWGSKQSYYDHALDIHANATFPEGCSSTGIAWTKTIWSFPFFETVTLATGNDLSLSPTENQTITVTARCDLAQVVTTVFITVIPPSVNAGAASSHSPGDTVSLSGSIIWTAPWCSVFSYSWEQVSGVSVPIENANAIEIMSSSYSAASFVFPDTEGDVSFRLTVSPSSCYHSLSSYSSTVTYSRWTSPSYWGISYSSRMRDEADELFRTNFTNAATPVLSLDETPYPALRLRASDIWWEWYVSYRFEYSTGSAFDSPSVWTEPFNEKVVFPTDVSSKSDIHYFRVKACYLGKCSNYSDVVRYVDSGNPLARFNVSRRNAFGSVVFSDIMKSSTILLESVFRIRCPSGHGDCPAFRTRKNE